MARTFVKGSDIAGATIATGNLMDSAITTAKISDLNVTADKLAADSVLTAKIADLNVTTGKIADNAITSAKLADASVDTLAIIDANVTTSKVADNAITSVKLAADAVETAKILDAQVTTAKLAANAVTPAKADLAATWTFTDFRGTFGADVSAGGFKLSNLASPVGNSDAATKQYVDGVAQGLDVKQSVSAIARGNITLSGPQTIDGVALVAGDRVLVSGQTTGSQNGIYVVAASAWSRASDMDTGSDAAGAFTFVEQGTVNADSGWVCTNNAGSAVVGTDALVFSQFSGAGSIVAGAGLSKSGNTLDVNVGDGVQIVSDAVALKLDAVNPGLSLGAAGVKVLLNAGATGNIRPSIAVDGAGLSIKIDNSTMDADGTGQLRIKSLGVNTTQIADNAITSAKLADGSVDTLAIIDANVTYGKLASDVTTRIGRFDSYQAGALTGSAPFSIALSSAPQTLDAALLVFVNGVMRTKANDYTLSGSTITFDASVGAQGDDYAVYYGLPG
jgi:hypothetical protein